MAVYIRIGKSQRWRDHQVNVIAKPNKASHMSFRHQKNVEEFCTAYLT